MDLTLKRLFHEKFGRLVMNNCRTSVSQVSRFKLNSLNLCWVWVQRIPNPFKKQGICFYIQVSRFWFSQRNAPQEATGLQWQGLSYSDNYEVGILPLLAASCFVSITGDELHLRRLSPVFSTFQLLNNIIGLGFVISRITKDGVRVISRS